MSARIERVRDSSDMSSRMSDEVREGLQKRPLPELPSKYFYDDRGSALFDDITRLPEYYPTRTEEAILETIAQEVVDRVQPRELCELGSGVGRKVRLLLDAMAHRELLERCVLLDISEGFLIESARQLDADYPDLAVRGVVGDFLEDLPALGAGGGRLALFLAGTIGNLHPDRVPPFLRDLARQLDPGDAFLLGLDLVKDAARLHAAYNDSAGVTAEFNRNILRVVNTHLGADFEPEAFEHVAFYDPDNAWIEMRLRATRGMRVSIPGANLQMVLEPGDEIRTELSCKYTRGSLEARLPGTGLCVEAWYTDPDQLFACALLRRSHETIPSEEEP
ncbi:MAG: L-histidine N(alpha)-methyltransferase [Acidobacteria bacterium]|nr:L-histidine N(alpha)-methyltransferase [Acidobacteriota bacterium]